MGAIKRRAIQLRNKYLKERLENTVQLCSSTLLDVLLLDKTA